MATLQLNFSGSGTDYISFINHNMDIIICEASKSESELYTGQGNMVIIDAEEWENLKSFIDNQIANIKKQIDGHI